MSPLVVIFLTIFVNLVGFGIIIPLLPFYAETFGASPIAIGLMFASFSISQLIASPVLGHLSDRWGRRPVLIFSLLGTVVSFGMLALSGSLTLLFLSRIVDGLSGGNISTARAYVADVTEPKDRARAYGVIGAAFGLGFIVGPALGGAFSHLSYTAPIWAAAAITLVAAVMAYLWLPETVHRAHAGTGSPFTGLGGLIARPGLRRLLAVDFVYWTAFALYQTTFALFGAARFQFDAPQTGYFLSGFGVLAVLVQLAIIKPVVHAVGEQKAFAWGLACAAVGLIAVAMTHSVLLFAIALVPVGVGVGVCQPTFSSLLSKSVPPEEQGRVQGTAGALESLGRTIGPVWGNASLQRFGEGTPYVTAGVCLMAVVAVVAGYHAPVGEGERVGAGRP